MVSRRAFTGAAALALVGALGACASEDDQVSVVLVDAPPPSAVLPGDDPAATALALSTALFASAEVVVLATADTLEALAPLSARAGLPLLVGTDRTIAEELSRLGADTVLTATGTPLDGLEESFEVLELDPAATDVELPAVRQQGHPLALTLCLDPDQTLPGQLVATASVEAVGGTIAEIPGGALGRSADTVAAVTRAAGEDPSTGVLALGGTFGSPDGWADRLRRTLTTPQLPGGGLTAFPGRRMVAMYGSPGVPSLGVLGEQGIQESIARVQELAAQYEGLSDEQVIPAFEIISTIASDEAGADGDHSRALPADSLRDWVDAAGEAGVYVVLDLQPGTTDFLTQARLYEDLLTAPHVGLALDPEWRLEPGQKHLEQIGSVTAAEINEVSTWLADLTADHGLPQKVFVLHQFTHSMISDRQDVDTSRPELAITLHADGHGVPGDKLGTYRSLQQGLPEGIFMAWKNFHDEDSPMFTPEETCAVEPRPWFVSYQ
jgi:hypothetical protein